MKKLLALLLVVLMCLGMLAGCGFFGDKPDENPDENPGDNTGDTPGEDTPGEKPDEPAGPTVDAAASFLYDIYKTENGKKVDKDFDIVKQVMIEGVLFPVAWTVDTDLISFKDSATAGYLTVDLPDENDTEITFTLTATIADAKGNTAVKTFTRVLDDYYFVPEGPEKPDMVSEPQAGVEYKFYIYQNFLKKHLFATSAIETQYNQYLISTEDYNEAMSLYVEPVEGGYNFYTTIDGAKKYINMADKQSGTNNDGSPKYYAGVVYGDEATTVWTYVADISAWSAKYEGREYVMGTYGNYNDFRFSAISYYYGTQAATQCAAGLLTVEMAENLPEWPTVEVPETPAPEVNKGYHVVGVNKDGDLYFDGGISSGRFSGSNDVADAIVIFVKAGAKDGEYLLCFYDAENRANYLIMNDSSTGAAITLYADEASVFEWNGTLATFVVAEDSNNRAFGTQEGSSYTTFSCYDISNIYVWAEYKLVEGASEPESITPPPEKEPEVGPETMTLTEALAAADGTKIVVSGKVIAINEAWSEQYGNICVTIEDADGVQLYVYRMKTNVVEGDIITVTGEMTTYSGKRQVAQGATAVITGHEDVADYAEYTIPEILALPDNTKIIVKGTVSEIVKEWQSEGFDNMCVNIVDADGNVLYVYRLSTEVKLGDIVTITGLVGSYKDAKQVAQGATAVITGHDDSYDNQDPVDPEEPEEPDVPTDYVPTAGAPEVGKGYYIVGVNSNGNIYFNGTAGSGRFNAATSVDGAAVVYVTLVADGQYVIYFDVDGTANYVVMADSSTGGSLTTDKSKASAFEWNATLKTFEVADDENARAFATKHANSYTNFNCYAVSNASDPAYAWAQFVAVDGGDDPVDPDPTPDPEPEVPEYTEMTLTEALAAADGTKIIVSGKVIAINQAWSEQYGNISVTIEDADGVQLYVYRMKTNVVEGDIITVTGEMTTYSNARQVAAGATAVITGHEDVADYAEYTIPEILELPDNTKIIVKGIVSEIVKEWQAEGYDNMCVNIVDADGNVLYVYRLSTKVEVNDIVTITGLVGSYKGAKQVAQGATAEITGKYEPAPEEPEVDYSALDALDGQYVINFIMNGAYYLTFNKEGSTLTVVDNIGDFDGTYFYSYDAATGITVDGADIVFAVDGENVTVSIGGGAVMTLIKYEEPTPDPDVPATDFSALDALDGKYVVNFIMNGAYELVFDKAAGTIKVTDNISNVFTGTFNYTYSAETGITVEGANIIFGVAEDGSVTVSIGGGAIMPLIKDESTDVPGGDDEEDDNVIVLEGTEGVITLTATDTYGAFDLYTIKATIAGTYNFAFAAGNGMVLKATDEAWGMPEVDFYDGGIFTITLEADESFVFYFMSVTKGTFDIPYSTGDIVIVEPTALEVGENTLTFTEDQLFDGIECTFFPTATGLYSFVSDTLGATIYSAEGDYIGRNSAQLESYVSYKIVIYSISALEAGDYTINVVAPLSLDAESDNYVTLYDFQISGGFVATVYPWNTGALSITSEYLTVTGVSDSDGNALTANADGSYDVESWTNYTVYFEAKEGATAGDHIISCSLLAAPGTVNNPYTLADSNNIAFGAEGNVYFTYTATANGHIVFGCDAENLEIRDTDWNFYTVGTSYLVLAGQTYVFCFGTSDYAALETVVTVSFTEGEPTDDDYKNMLNGGFFYIDQYEVNFSEGKINVSLYDWTIWDFALNLWFDYSITVNEDGTITIVPAYVYTEGEVGEDFGFAGATITATLVDGFYEFTHNIGATEEPEEPEVPDVPAELEGDIYIGTDDWGNEIFVAISDTTVTFSIRDNIYAYTYMTVDGAIVLLNADGSEVMALMASVTVDENGVPTAAVYNGTNYTLVAQESDDVTEEEGTSYTAVDDWGNEIVVTISNTTVTFSIRGNDYAYTYITVDGAIVLLNADGSEVMALMASVTVDENGVPTAAVYNGTNYTFANEDDSETPEESGFEGEYNATADGAPALTVVITAADITFSYSHPMTGMPFSTVYDYAVVAGNIVLYHPGTSYEVDPWEAGFIVVDGAITSIFMQGTEFVLATDEPEIPDVPVVNNVAEIDGVGYESLEAALEAAGDYSVITLLDNITLTAQLTIRKNVFINLNGFTISGDFESDYGMIYVAPEFELDIFDTAEVMGSIVSSGSYAIGVYGILYIYADIDVISTATYNEDGVDYEYAGIYVFAQGETAGFADIAEANVSSIWNSGSLNFAAETNLIISSGYCTISGGTIGEFVNEEGATAAISGGIFGNDVSAWVAADYVCVANDDGTYSIKYLPTIAIADAEWYEDGTEVIVSGTVTAITTAWNDSFGNITVVLTDDTGSITLYRLSTKVALGDIITVTGKIGSYNDVKQIAQGATAVITGHDSDYDYVEMTIADALKAADETGVIVTGTVVEIGTAYDSYYKNISVYIADENGTQLYLYRLTGNVTVGQIITVKGSMATYGGQRQIGAGATFEVVGTHTCSNFTEATCESAAKCIVCGTANGEALEHVFVDGECENCGAAENAKEVISATLSFADKANRVSQTSSQQVWAQNGITLTNDKGSSTSNVADYANPARFYKSSKITVAHEGMVKIVFTCNNNSYATALKSSISGANVTVDGKNVTVTFDEPVDSFVIASLTGGQVRMDSMTVYYEA